MSLEVIPFDGLADLMAKLEAFALSDTDYVFRGHQQDDWRVETTLARHRSRPHQGWDSDIDEMLDHFIVNARSIGEVPFDILDRRSRLEYGRHYGVPTPLIDFSWSPYVALFFAFNSLRYKRDEPSGNAAIYVLDVAAFGSAWANRLGGDFMLEFNAFTREHGLSFQYGYPADRLKFFNFPASWNQRMQRQLGCFIYDTIDYGARGLKDFEALADSLEEIPGPEGQPVILRKFLVPHAAASEVFRRLELMNINATKLIDHEGLSADVRNAYYYNRKTGYAWDVRLPPPDDTKM